MGFVRWLKLYIRCLFYTISFTIPNSPNTHVFCGQWYTSSPPWRKPGTASQVWCHFLGSLGFGRIESPAHPQHLWLASQDALPSANTHWACPKIRYLHVSTNCNGLPWFIMVNYDFLWSIIMIYAIFHCQCHRCASCTSDTATWSGARLCCFFRENPQGNWPMKMMWVQNCRMFWSKSLGVSGRHSTNKSVDSRFSSVSMPRNIGHTSNHRFYWPKPEDLNQHWGWRAAFPCHYWLMEGKNSQLKPTMHQSVLGGKPNVNYMYMYI